MILGWDPELNLVMLQEIVSGAGNVPMAGGWHLAPASQVIYSGTGPAPVVTPTVRQDQQQ